VLPLARQVIRDMTEPRMNQQLPNRTQKAAQDTAAGCRDFAAADVARASLMDTANGRRRLETSARNWGTRADMIQGLDDRSFARHAIARAEWEAEEPGRNRPKLGTGAAL
jgi:hypothetical protein